MSLFPDRDAFLRLAAQGDWIPVCRRLMGDLLTPVAAFARLGGARQGFLLESVTGGEKVGRYSFLGVEPRRTLRAFGREVETAERGEAPVRETCAAPLDRLAALVAGVRPVAVPGLPRFTGGAVGYFGYDVVRQIEHLPSPPARSLGLPDIHFGLYDEMLVFDHVTKTCTVIAHADCRRLSPAAAWEDARARIDRIVARLAEPSPLPVEDAPVLPATDPAFTSNMRRADYFAAVERCKDYIRAGDIFQVVLSQRLSAPCNADPFRIYRNLRVINPSPYMFFLRFPELSLVGSSPEVMVRVEGRRVTVRPIAGTRRRGRDEAEDAALSTELLADPKERAEHTMLVDLGRNDVGRVCGYGAVRLTEAMTVERYSHVMHIVSNVEGELRPECSALDALKACLPAGTVSGAPKVRAMQILDEVEPDRRGPYAGAVGYLDYSGNLDTCITIRTILLHDGMAHVQSGGGLVADSVPESEFIETENKAKALLKAIQVTT